MEMLRRKKNANSSLFICISATVLLQFFSVTYAGVLNLDFKPTAHPNAKAANLRYGGRSGYSGSQVLKKCNSNDPCLRIRNPTDESTCARFACCWDGEKCNKAQFHILSLRTRCAPGFIDPPKCRPNPNVHFNVEGYEVSVDELTTVGSVLIQVAAVVPEPHPSVLSYSIVQGTADADMVTINGAGEVILIVGLDFESASMHSVIIEVTNVATGNSAQTTLTINVNNENEFTPAFGRAATVVTLPYDTAVPTTLTTLDVTDGDGDDEFGMSGVTVAFSNPDDAATFAITEIAAGSYSVELIAVAASGIHTILIDATDSSGATSQAIVSLELVAAVDVTIVFSDAYQAALADPLSDEYFDMVLRANAALAELLAGTGGTVDSINWIFSPGSVVAEAANTNIVGVPGSTDINGAVSDNAGAVTDDAVTSVNSGTSTDECADVTCVHGTCVDGIDKFTCVCETGWTGTFCEEDINECDTDNGGCANGAECVNVDATFSCTCAAGWTGTLCTENINECDTDNGGCVNGACVDNEGSFECNCVSGWTGQLCDTDINECDTDNGGCVNGGCENNDGSFTCNCNAGWQGDLCDTDINECTAGTHGCVNGACDNNDGSYTCNCDPGWQGDLCDQDINECDTDDGGCVNGACENNDGSFTCNCVAGWQGDLCDTDINECETDNGGCVNGACENNDGSFTCNCVAGWQGDLCDQDINECTAGTHGCVNGECENNDGSYTCNCNAGWTGTLCDQDINECDTDNGGCVNGACENNDGSFTCNCVAGWQGDLCDQDINECTAGTHECVNGECENNDGSYTCNCNAGWTGTLCDEDIDECGLIENGGCVNGACVNTDGTFSCECNAGWNEFFCDTNINECEVGTPCENGGACEDTEGSFQCTCTAGWEGATCALDIDECDRDLDGCDHGTCVDTDGSYTCDCDAGWKGDLCDTDIDECVEDPQCENGAECTNNDGSFECTCASGWTGALCAIDINECEPNSGNGDCKHGAGCENKDGSFTCRCEPGYEGTLCELNVDECATDNGGCVNGATCKDSFGSFECECVLGYHGKLCTEDDNECEPNDGNGDCENLSTCQNTVGSFNCECVDGSGWTGALCNEDINECDTDNGGCLNSGECINKVPGYECDCSAAIGYEGDHCETDIDECALDTDSCDLDHGTCRDTDGSYECDCDVGWGGTLCDTDIDECQTDNGGCLNDATCVNNDGSFECDCDFGWQGDSCEKDIDECETNGGFGPCMNEATCDNNDGSFECECQAGWEGPLCNDDIDECATDDEDGNPGGCEHGSQCVNEYPGYRCDCLAGWEGDHCETDIDECAKETDGCVHGECRDTDGSYECDCEDGWEGDLCDQDIDECATDDADGDAGGCKHGSTCVDTDPGYSCTCVDGWEGDHCETDIDECALETDGCVHGECRDTDGSYECDCEDGWEGDLCDQDIDECATDDADGNPGGCKHGSTCVDSDPSYSCTCTAGWEGDHCETDIDECAKETDGCVHGECRDTDGSYECDCEDGWEGDLCDQDIDECATDDADGDAGGCKHGSTCVDTDPGYSCTCVDGWEGDHCETDIDECATDNGGCLHSSECVNNQPGYECDCTAAPGYEGDHCEKDINECLNNFGDCQQDSECKNVEASYFCECLPGWTGDLCNEDIDECSQTPAVCENGGACTDTDGSFTCDCSAIGWRGDTCSEEIDECAEGTALCNTDHTTSCENVPAGSYTCHCQDGWEGTYCDDDVDECDVDNGEPLTCKNGGTCIDTEGSFECNCVAGYKGDTCEEDALKFDPVSYTATIAETKALDEAFLTLSATLPSTSTATVSYEMQADYADMFSVSPAGEVGLATYPDYEAAKSHTFTIKASADGEPSVYATVTVTITNTNDHEPQFEEMTDYYGRVPDYYAPRVYLPDTPYTAWDKAILTFRVSDLDEDDFGNIGTVEITFGPDWFVLEELDGLYSLKLDQVKGTFSGIHKLALTASDAGGNIATMEVFVYLTALIDVEYIWAHGFGEEDYSAGSASSYDMIANAKIVFESHMATVGTINSDYLNWYLSEDTASGYLKMNAYNVGIYDFSSLYTTDLSAYLTDTGGNLGTMPAPVPWVFDNHGLSDFSLDSFTYTAAVDDCGSTNPCQNNGFCYDDGNGYGCRCADGFDGDNCENDINECDNSPCNGGTCDGASPPGSYTCTCTGTGYEGTNCDIDIDECANDDDNNCDLTKSKCVNNEGAYECVCNDGWEGADCQTDINECNLDSTHPQYQQCDASNTASCENKDNGYTCVCNEGWEGTFCSDDINECDTDNGGCKNGATCLNYAGEFECACAVHWKGPTCEEDALKWDETSYAFEVSEDATVGSVLGYMTATVPGGGASNVQYTVTSANAAIITIQSNGKVTLGEQVDYEAQYTHVFTVQASNLGYLDPDVSVELTVTVINTNDNLPVISEVESFDLDYNEETGSAVARMKVTDADKKTFGVIKSVEVDSDVFETKIDTDADYYKVLTTDKVASGDYTLTVTVTDGGDATSTAEVSFKITAKVDVVITFDNEFTDDLNDPTSQAHIDMTAKAQNALALAASGVGDPDASNVEFTFSEGSVVAKSANVDMVGVVPATDDLPAAINANTGNVDDPDLISFGAATPVDNCDGHECVNGVCVDGVDSYTCDCDTGYYGTFCADAITCADVSAPDNGQIIGDCVESYNNDCEFECDTGYQLIGVATITCNSDGDDTDGEGVFSNSVPTCQKVTCGAIVAPTNGAAVKKDTTDEACTDSYLDECTFTCDSGFEMSGDAEVICNSDGDDSDGEGVWSAEEPVCVDIDECYEGSDDCDMAQCMNTDGSYWCDCDPGWEGDLCDTDIDECATNDGNCVNFKECQNSDGSFLCVCQDGWEGKYCEKDINECSKADYGGCLHNSKCVNTDGGHNCDCTGTGWSGDTCQIDVNECDPSVTPAVCDETGTEKCENNDGGYECVCNAGWDGDDCATDIDECAEGTDECDHGTCRDTDGSYACDCEDGWEGDLCDTDIDECNPDLAKCEDEGTYRCDNNDGSYACVCYVGYKGDDCSEDALRWKSIAYAGSIKEDEVDTHAVRQVSIKGSTDPLVIETEHKDPNNAVTFTIVYDDEVTDSNLPFELTPDGAAGTATIVTQELLDYEKVQSYKFTVRASDSTHPDVDTVVTISVLNVNDFDPGFYDTDDVKKDDFGTVDINWDDTTYSVLSFYVLDGDRNNGLEYGTIAKVKIAAGNEDDLFEIETINAQAGLEYHLKTKDRLITGDYELTLAASDKGGNIHIATVTVSIHAHIDAVFTCQEGWSANMADLADTSSQTYADFTESFINDLSSDITSKNPGITGTTLEYTGTWEFVQHGVLADGFKGNAYSIDVIGFDTDSLNIIEIADLFNTNIVSTKTECTDYSPVVASASDNCPSVNPCNNGDCVDDGNSHKCVCNLGWKGSDCSENIDECTLTDGDEHYDQYQKCNTDNTEQCIDTQDNKRYECQCKTGWTGTYCDDDVDECNLDSSDPQYQQCHADNTDSCKNIVGSYICVCKKGWEGTDCATDIDECDEGTDECDHGTCSNEDGGYTCDCEDGWEGDLCDTDIDECLANSGSGDCENDAKCKNTDGDYECQCVGHFKGKNCDTPSLQFSAESYEADPDVPETSAIGHVVATVEATIPGDPMASTAVVYAVTDGDQSLINIDNSNGEVSLAQQLDFETETSHEFEITASNPDGDDKDVTVTLTVGVENENDNTPYFGDVEEVEVDHTAAVGAEAVTFSVQDDDSGRFGEISTIEITAGNDDNYFAIKYGTAPVNYVVTASQPPSGEYLLTLRATDGGGDQTATQEVTVKIVAKMDFAVTFSETYSDDLNDPSTQAHADMVDKANSALEAATDGIGQTDPSQVSYTFEAGSVVANAANVPVSGIGADTSDVANAVSDSGNLDNVANLPGVSAVAASTPVDDCIGHGCVNGDCVDGIGKYTCNCYEGWWKDMCDERITCGAVATSANGKSEKTGQTDVACTDSFEDSCSFACNDGYKLTGSDVAVCSSDGDDSDGEGEWSPEEPTCDLILTGACTDDSSCTGVANAECGTSSTCECGSGYQANTASTACELILTALTGTGYVSSSCDSSWTSFDPPGTCTITCAAGYSNDGYSSGSSSFTATCQNGGSWDMECTEVADNGVVECDIPDATVTASCDGGEVISVLYGFYGWKEESYNSEHVPCTADTQTPCQSSTADGLIKSACNGETSCTFNVNSGGLGATDCAPGTVKFGEILYNCS